MYLYHYFILPIQNYSTILHYISFYFDLIFCLVYTYINAVFTIFILAYITLKESQYPWA